MPFAQVQTLAMYYEERGSSTGVPLVLLHNFTATGATAWSDLYSAFGAYRLIVPDWRGHGRTANPDGPPAMNHRQYARDIAGLIRTLNLSMPVLCGLSSGAMMLLSALVDDSGLGQAAILAGGTHYIPESTKAWMRAQAPESLPPSRVQQMQSMHNQDSDHWLRVQKAFVASADRDTSADYPSREEMARISLPTLIIHGDRDPLFPVEIPMEQYSLLPNSELCILPNTTHLVQRSSPQLFVAAALGFMNRHSASS